MASKRPAIFDIALAIEGMLGCCKYCLNESVCLARLFSHALVHIKLASLAGALLAIKDHISPPSLTNV